MTAWEQSKSIGRARCALTGARTLARQLVYGTPVRAVERSRPPPPLGRTYGSYFAGHVANRKQVNEASR